MNGEDSKEKVGIQEIFARGRKGEGFYVCNCYTFNKVSLWVRMS